MFAYTLRDHKERVFAQDADQAVIWAWERALADRLNVFDCKSVRRASGQKGEWIVTLQIREGA